MVTRNIEKTTTNSRLLKNYGSWLYCSNCNKTVAYICYSTYQWINISFSCSCGSKGNLELKEAELEIQGQPENGYELILKNNRYCCPRDESPLFSVVTKQIDSLEYEVSCLECKRLFGGTIGSKQNHE
jgi:5-methylcytosine-specific restriction endonuclease McrA